jgi:hypothetical protein
VPAGYAGSMRADRAAAGLSGAAILVVIALSAGGVAVIETVLLVAAGLIVLATFAPALPVLHRMPLIGGPRVSVILSFEGAGVTRDAFARRYDGASRRVCQ